MKPASSFIEKGRYHDLMSLQMPVAYITDIEGNIEKLWAFFEGHPAFFLSDEGQHQLKPGWVFVFGGDTWDRFSGMRQVLRELIRLKNETPDRVVLLCGNRDLNKVLVFFEISQELLLKKTTTNFLKKRFDFYKREFPSLVFLGSRSEKLKFLLSRTLNASSAFEMYRNELEKELNCSLNESEVADHYYLDITSEGLMFEYLSLCQLAFCYGNTLYVHCGVTDKNFGKVPGEEPVESVSEWVTNLNRWKDRLWKTYQCSLNQPISWLEKELKPLLQYCAPVLGKSVNPESVVYGRAVDSMGIPLVPSKKITSLLLKEGILRCLHGDIPCGDIPLVRSQNGFQVIVADNSYSPLKVNPCLISVYSDHVKVEGRILTPQEERLSYQITPDAELYSVDTHQEGGIPVLKQNKRTLYYYYQKKGFLVRYEWRE